VIIVDSREPKEIVDLIKRENVPVDIRDIQWTDYLVCYGDYAIPVERKAAEDFVASIQDGRIFNQAYMMSTLSPVGYIIVEGTPSLALFERKFPRRAYIGALASLALKRSPYGHRGQISIIVVDSYHDTALFLALLYKQLQEGKLDRLPKLVVKGKRLLDKKGVMIAMLQAIPGVGQERARMIAEHFNSISELVRASVSDIARVKGVSIELARRIKDYLN